MLWVVLVGEANLTLEGRAQCSQLDGLEAVWGQPTETGAPLRARDRPRPRKPSRATLVPPAGRSRTRLFKVHGSGSTSAPAARAAPALVGGLLSPQRGRRACRGAAGGGGGPAGRLPEGCASLIGPLGALFAPNAASRRPCSCLLLHAGRRSSRGGAGKYHRKTLELETFPVFPFGALELLGIAEYFFLATLVVTSRGRWRKGERGLDSGCPHPDTAPRALGRELRASGAAQPAGMRREGGGRRTKPVRTGTDPRAELSRTSPPVHGRSRPRGWRVNALSGRATQENA